MATAEKTLHVCPICKNKTLVSHCADDHPACTWMKCRTDGCDSTIDPGRKRGMRVNIATGATEYIDIA